MAAETHSFIDIAALDSVRRHFAAADAVVILSLDLSQVIWANGPGAGLLGFAGIEAAIGASAGLSRQAMRQIEATPGYPEIGADRAISIRMASGVISQMTTLRASHLVLPGGESAIMLVQPFGGGQWRSAAEIGARAIGGFEEPGNYLAMISNDEIVAATAGFATLGIDRATLAKLTADVVGEDDRLLKRIVQVEGRAMPMGFARLRDDPPLDLLITVDERWGGEDEAAIEPPVQPTHVDEPGEDPGELRQPGTVEGGNVRPSADAEDATPFSTELATETGDQEVVQGSPAESDTTTVTGVSPDVSIAEPALLRATQHDSWYFSDRSVRSSEHENAPEADRQSSPVRFVWRTDADGHFTAISSEFVAVVGEDAANVIGKTFAELAKRLALDPDGEIGGLLARRDTWSGRSVLWPVAGTDLKVPVDLAALPAYDRDRTFEGFRGFGVVRRADAVVDPGALGLSLEGAAGAAIAEPEIGLVAAAESGAAPIDDDDPFRGEVPALAIDTNKQGRRFNDKIISLAEHRTPANDKGLTPLERNAFREIGEQLKRTSGDATEAAEARPADTDTSSAPSDDARMETASDQPNEVASNQAAEPSISAPVARAVEAADAPEWHEAAEATRETPEIEATEPSPPALVDAAEAGTRADAEDQPPADTGAPVTAESSPGSKDADMRAVAEPVGPAPVEPRPAHVSRSLLDFASDQEDEPVAAMLPETPEMAPGDNVETASSTDSGPAADPVADADGESIVVTEAQSGFGSEPKFERLHEAPPLKQAGFLPSAFAERQPESARADTSILAQLPIPVLIHSGDTLHYANDAFLELTGYESVRALADQGGLDAILSGPAEDRTEGDNRVMLKRRDGEQLPVGAFLQSVPWLGGKALLLTITRQPTSATPPVATPPAESVIDERVAELRTILDTATDGVVLIANDGTVRSISRPAEALFGYEGEEVVGKPFTALFAIESQRSAREYLNSLSDNGVASVLNDGREVIGREAQGRFIPLFMTIGRLPGNSGFCAVLRDITQWKRAEEDLTQARAQAERTSSQKSDFLARISHEIRTPLNAIIGFSELMLDEKFGPVANDRYRDYLRDINRSGNHVLDLVNDLLDISKIEAGQQELDYEAVALNDALSETVAMMQPQANRERVIIRSSFASRLPEVVADLRSVRQIALNILSNAVRYTQAGGQVIVSTAYEPNGEVVMRVRDTGIGMSQAEIEQALKPFKQINALKRARGDGTGLGLPLTKAMVEANRAKFSIISTPGEGTLVEVAFPSTRVLAD